MLTKGVMKLCKNEKYMHSSNASIESNTNTAEMIVGYHRYFSGAPSSMPMIFKWSIAFEILFQIIMLINDVFLSRFSGAARISVRGNTLGGSAWYGVRGPTPLGCRKIFESLQMIFEENCKLYRKIEK